jgi:transcriptional regulator with XRE-family HTH domain
MSEYVIRRERLNDWMKARGISGAELARRMECGPNYISSITNNSQGKAANIGERTARKLEAALGMSNKYLDGDQPAQDPSPNRITPIGELFPVPQLVRGKGSIKTEPTRVQWIARSTLEEAHIRPEVAAWMVMESQDMEPRLPKGAKLFLDLSETQPIDGGTYALSWREQIIVRRVFQTPSGFKLTLEAAPEAAITLSEAEMRSQVIVAGRIRISTQTNI